jgi:hypothetical protein
MLVVLFFFVEVANARAVVDAGLATDYAGLDQEMVDEGRFTGRAVAAYRDVANVVNFSRHDDS